MSLFTASLEFPDGPADAPRLILIGESLDRWSAAWAADLASDGEAHAALAALFRVQVVDAAEDPALARRAALVLALTGDAAGLPLALFCLPDGRPVGAVPWRPLRDQGKTPGLLRTALEFAEAWHQQPEAVTADADHLERLADSLAAADTGPALRPGLVLEAAESAALEAANTLEGGFGPVPRRLDPALLEFLLGRCARADAPLGLVQQVERTFAALESGAAHDHLHGGFHRGCEDAAWSRPLAEKRLGDQAQLAVLLARASDVLDQPLHRTLARRALTWVLADLARGDGLFAHGRHAGPPQAPAGAAYAWTPQGIADLVGDEGADVLCRRFGLAEHDPDQPGFLAIRSPVEPATAKRLPELVNRLAAARTERAQPPRDPTARLEDQGTLLLALVALESEDPAFATAADALAARLRSDPLPARWRADGHGEGTPGPGELAAVARGLLAHHRARGGSVVPALIRALAERAFAAVDAAGHVRLDERTPPALSDTDDGDGPSAAALLGHLALDLGEPADLARANALVHAHRERLRRAPLALAGLLAVLDRVST